MKNIENKIVSKKSKEIKKDEPSIIQFLPEELRRQYQEIMKRKKEGEEVDLVKRWPSYKLKYNFGEAFKLKPTLRGSWCTNTDLGKKELFYPVDAIRIPKDISEQEKEEKKEIIDGGVAHEAGHHLGVVKVLENFIFEKDTQNKLFNQFEIKSAPLKDRKEIQRQLQQRGESFIEQNINVGPYIGNILFLKDLHNVILDIWLESYEKQMPDSPFSRKIKRGIDSLNKSLFPDKPPASIRFKKTKLNKMQFKARFKNDTELKEYLLNNIPEDKKDNITDQQINNFISSIKKQLKEKGEIVLKKSQLLSSQFKQALLLAAMRPDWEEWQGEKWALWQKKGWVDPRVADSLKRIQKQAAFKNLLTVKGLDEAFTPKEVIKWVQENKMKQSYDQIRAEFLSLFDIDFQNKVNEVAAEYGINKKNKKTFDENTIDKKSFTSQDANDVLTDILINGIKESQHDQGSRQGGRSSQSSQGQGQEQNQSHEQGDGEQEENQQGESSQGQGQEQKGDKQEGEQGDKENSQDGKGGQGQNQRQQQSSAGQGQPQGQAQGHAQGGSNFDDLPSQGQRDVLEDLLDQMDQEGVGRESLSEENQDFSEDIQDQARDSIPSMKPEDKGGGKEGKDGEDQDKGEEEEEIIGEREARMRRRMNANQRMAQKHQSTEMRKAELLGLSAEEFKDYKKARERLNRQINILSKKLSEILIANREMQTKKRLPHGRLTPGKLGSFVRAVSSGYEPDSFEVPQLADKPMNIDLMFLVDHSGSMAGPPIQAAADSALIWAEAIRKAENNVEKQVSTSRQKREGLRMGLMTFSNQPVLWDDLKDDLDDKDVAKIYTKTKDLEGGFTADASAVRELLKYLNKEGERKKQKTLQIIVVLTDGQGEYDKVKKIIDENMKNKSSILVALGMGDGTEDVLKTYKSDKYKNRVIAKPIPDKDISDTGEISAAILIKPIKESLLGK